MDEIGLANFTRQKGNDRKNIMVEKEKVVSTSVRNGKLNRTGHKVISGEKSHESC